MENRKLLVKHLQQGPNQCGPTALAMVLDYWQRPAELAAVVRAIKPLDFMYSASLDLAGYARGLGLLARPYNTCTWEELREMLRAGIPPIALIDPGDRPDWNLHYVVVNGFLEDGADRRIFYVDPGQAAPSGQRELAWSEFVRRWSRLRLGRWSTGMDRYLLVIAPPEAEPALPPYDRDRCRLPADQAAWLASRTLNGAAALAGRVWRTAAGFAWFLRPRRFDKR